MNGCAPRVVNKPWHVRFDDGTEHLAQVGDTLTILTVDGKHLEAFVIFDAIQRTGWWSWASVLWYSDRIEAG